MDLIIQTIKAAGRILVTAHTDPDGDAVGSLLAMGLALERLGKQTTLYNESPIPAVYQFLPAVNRIARHLKTAADYDAAVVLDCGDPARIGGAGRDVVERVASVINIDHHVSNTGFGSHRLIDGRACATAEIVYRLICALGIPLDKDIATCIYTGILTDTGSFRFSNTNASAFAISREMMEIGVNPFEVAQHVFGSYSLGRIKLLNLALNSIEISHNGKLSLMTITRGMLEETRTQQEDVDGLINYARRIEDVRVAALIQEQINGRTAADGRARLHVSLRSDGSVDVAALAGTFGGGGHHSAAGFQIESTLAGIKSELLAWAERMD
jgi:phosphoesterase RecJ-like protein